MSAPEFILKTTPPRVPRTALEREPLQRIWSDVRERTAIAVIAPAGFGKTTLLAQWRRNWLKEGALVAWLAVDAQDDPTRFTLALLSAVSSASGRPAFDALMAQYAAESDHDIDALTGLLAEIAFLGTETVLVIDDAERLPDATVQNSLQYLLHNAPPNLHVVVGSRVPLSLQTWELMAKGNFATIGPDDLHLQLDESTAVLGKHFGQRLDLDQCTRLHEITGGWPLGLQLVAATIEREPDLAVAIDSISARRGDIERYFFESLLTRLPMPMTDFLIRIAILDHLAADLCAAVTGCASAGDFIARLMVETPILSVAGLQDWVRLHPLARDFLLSRFEQLPMAEQQELHARASHWFAERQRFHEAAGHALASGDESLAHAYAARALWTLTLQGKLLEAREWLDRIPPEVVAADVDLRLVGAWIMAIGGERNTEALEISQAILLDPATNPQRRFVAARAAFSAAAYGDRVGLMPTILADWLASRPESSASIEDPIQALAHANGVAFMALHAGETQHVRQLLGKAPANVDKDSLRLPIAHRLLVVGLSHLWDGEASRAEALLWPALVGAERIAGRRSMVASMYAAMVAAALLERDKPAAAQALLAHRLDVIERNGAPDIILLAYRTLAYVALSQGDERRALNIFESLGELAERRRLPRLMLHGFAERIRIHSLRGRSETVEALLQAMAELEDVFRQESFLPFQSQYMLTRAIATTYAALARNDLDECDRQLETADALANQLHRGRDALTIQVLRAVVAQRRHADNAMPLLAEALGLAAIRGSDRLLADTHPLAVQMGAALHPAPPGAKARTEPEPAPQPYSSLPERATAARGGLLTTKETEVLTLLDKGMSNKLIARAMEISDETVKWHIKNLFLKLAAGTRKHAVDRARLLGLLVQ